MKNYLLFNTVTSTIHASIMFLLSVLNISNSTLICGLKFSALYNIFDMIIMKKSKIRNQMLFHHSLLVIAAVYGILYPQKKILEIIQLGYITEITTPFLNIAWYYNLKKNKTKLDEKIMFTSSIITFILYLPCRVLLTTYISFKVQHIECSVKSIVYLFTLLNYMWYYKMCRKFRLMMIEVNV